MYTPSESDASKVESIFTYHRPTDAQIPRYEEIRERARDFAEFLVSACPASRELSLAITHLQITVMMANAAIAVNEVE